jgi:hypothetical protein
MQRVPLGRQQLVSAALSTALDGHAAWARTAQMSASHSRPAARTVGEDSRTSDRASRVPLSGPMVAFLADLERVRCTYHAHAER